MRKAVRQLQSIALTMSAPRLDDAVGLRLESGDAWLLGRDEVAYVNDYRTDLVFAANVQELLASADFFLNALYAFRSVARALPQLKPNEDKEVRDELHRASLKILLPNIRTLLDLHAFQKRITSQFFEACDRLASTRTVAIVPIETWENMIMLVDLLAQLDALKDGRASIAVELSLTKRILASLKDESMDDTLKTLQFFVADPRYPKLNMMFGLKNRISEIAGVQDVLEDLAGYCVEKLQGSLGSGKAKVIPRTTSWRYARGLAHLVLLGATSTNMVQRTLATFPVLPVMADVTMRVNFIIDKAEGYDKEKDVMAISSKVASRYVLRNHWARFRTEHNNVMISLQQILNDIQSPYPKPITGEAIYEKVLAGFRLLENLHNAVVEQSAWKHVNPAEDPEGEASEYERAIRMNYERDDIVALVDIISMIKSLSTLLLRAQPTLLPRIKQHMHACTQKLLQRDVLRMLYKAGKKKKAKATIDKLLQLRRVAADWFNGGENVEDYLSKELVKTNPVPLSSRNVAPSVTQLRVLHILVRTLYDERSKTMQRGLFKSKEFSAEQVEHFSSFFEASAEWEMLLNYNVSVSKRSNIGHLWYREYHLEMSRAVQFPISMSLPWILTEYIITYPQHGMLENLLYVLGIYNDAADSALHVFGQTFLYDEIEAEVNLVFDQLIFLLSDKIYNYMKDIAALSHVRTRRGLTMVAQLLQKWAISAMSPSCSSETCTFWGETLI